MLSRSSHVPEQQLPSTITELDPHVIGGVDTHKDFHVAVMINMIGHVLGTARFDATPAGYASLLAWMTGYGPSPRSASRAPARTGPVSLDTSPPPVSTSSRSTGPTAKHAAAGEVRPDRRRTRSTGRAVRRSQPDAEGHELHNRGRAGIASRSTLGYAQPDPSREPDPQLVLTAPADLRIKLADTGLVRLTAIMRCLKRYIIREVFNSMQQTTSLT